MSLVFGAMLFLLTAAYAIAVHASKKSVKALRKNCLRRTDEDSEF